MSNYGTLEQTLFVIICMMIILLVIFALVVAWQFVYATAIEGKLGPTLDEELLRRAQEWNIMTAINETLPLVHNFDFLEERLENK